MHEHDQDLIIALAEDTLDEQATAAARAEIAACAECSRDLELQRLALSALRELPVPYLSAAESADLHIALKNELGLRPQPATPRRSPIWARWVPVASAAVVLVALVISLPKILDSGFAGDSAMATTTAAADTTSAASEAAQAPLAAEDRAAEMLEAAGAMDDTATTAASETTEAAAEMTTTTAFAETTAADEASDAYGLLPYLGRVADLDRDDQLALLTDNGEEFRERSELEREASGALDACLEFTATSGEVLLLGIPAAAEPVVVGGVTADDGESLVLVAYIPEEISETVFVTTSLADCGIEVVLDQ